MSLQKTKRIRLKGKALAQLNSDIYERDGGVCVICGRFVLPGTKFHHEPCGAEKSDEIAKAVILCNECHYQRHHGKVKEYRQKAMEYLYDLYGGGEQTNV